MSVLNGFARAVRLLAMRQSDTRQWCGCGCPVCCAGWSSNTALPRRGFPYCCRLPVARLTSSSSAVLQPGWFERLTSSSSAG